MTPKLSREALSKLRAERGNLAPGEAADRKRKTTEVASAQATSSCTVPPAPPTRVTGAKRTGTEQKQPSDAELKKQRLIPSKDVTKKEGSKSSRDDGPMALFDDDHALTKTKCMVTRADLKFLSDQPASTVAQEFLVELSKDVDDFMIRRFLRARDLDIEKASAMFIRYLKWKRMFVPTGFISASEIATDLEQKKVFTQGLDKTGHPIMVAFAGRHFPRKGGLDEFKRYVVFTLNKLCSRMPAGQEKFTVIGDLEGWGYTNSDIRAYLEALSILQDYYPERLGKLFIIHVPYIFMTLWKAIYPFIDTTTKKKIVFVENKKLKSTLLEDIEESQLPEIYGGKLPLVPIQDS